MCHCVKHIGQAGILADKGKLDFSQVVEHFLNVNNIKGDGDLLLFDEHYTRAGMLWKERSRHRWIIDFGAYA